MPTVQIEYGKEARRRILAGAAKLNNAVKTTLGPSGRWVLFRHFGQVISTKDGVTVAREINLPDPYESIGADLIKGAANQAVNEAGDGTTTATLLAHAIFEAGCQAIDNDKAEPVDLVRGIERAVKEVAGEYDATTKRFHGGVLERLSIPTTPELAFQAARISANGDAAIAKVVSDAVIQVGVDGALTIGDSFSREHVLEKTAGMEMGSGLADPYFMNDIARNRCVLEDVTVAIINRRVNTGDEAGGILTAALKASVARSRPVAILIIADDFDPEALRLLLRNRLKHDNPIPVVAVCAQFWGDARRALLDDLCLLTGAERVSTPKGKDYALLTTSSFGHARRVVVTATKTLLTTEEPGDLRREKTIEPYLAGIQSLIDDEQLRPDERDAAKGRLAALKGGVAVIKVGGPSSDAVKAIKFQVEDAIHATRAAVAEGVVPGGGSALFLAGLQLGREGDPADPEERGYYLLLDQLHRPMEQIAMNAGRDGNGTIYAAQVYERDTDENYRFGFDATTGEIVPDLFAIGIVDPLRVVRCALNAAASAAGILLKTEAVITPEPENARTSR